ncbi:hypothetical protein K402DRAFT_418170 [Aulographum hederae CBS 113979]|uniref:Cytochrome b-c1 complex subunit 10 n=1 Tax=Aulographum hederae CBS 113979 TaxID=1176131 RepID=A0A6G1HAJ5_9PEZI|nr:hypothetical protein K402DRAFT_418170 [Aulographum hederae CBS 113979]
MFDAYTVPVLRMQDAASRESALRTLPRTGLRQLRQPFTVRRGIQTYKSPHGPAYKIATHVGGLDLTQGIRYGTTAATFGVVALIGLLTFFAEIPTVSRDIMQKIPILGPYFVNEIPPEDNPF